MKKLIALILSITFSFTQFAYSQDRAADIKLSDRVFVGTGESSRVSVKMIIDDLNKLDETTRSKKLAFEATKLAEFQVLLQTEEAKLAAALELAERNNLKEVAYKGTLGLMLASAATSGLSLFAWCLSGNKIVANAHRTSGFIFVTSLIVFSASALTNEYLDGQIIIERKQLKKMESRIAELRLLSQRVQTSIETLTRYYSLNAN